MQITRMMTIAENSNTSIKQSDNGKIYLYYKNAKVFFNQGAFLQFMIQIDDWAIKNKFGREDLVIDSCRFSVKVYEQDIENFIETVREAAYKLVPILGYYDELNNNAQSLKTRSN